MDEPKSNLPKKEQGELLIIDGNPEVEEPCMFERGMGFSVFYCLCVLLKDTSTYILEAQVLYEKYPELNEYEEVRIEDIGEDHWRYVDKDGEDKSEIHALRKEGLKKR